MASFPFNSFQRFVSWDSACSLEDFGRWTTRLPGSFLMHRGLKDAELKLPQSAWKGATFWLLVSVSLASLMAESSVWWQVRTWKTSPPMTPHLPSVVPFALCGGLAWLIARHSYVRSSMQAYRGE